MADPSEHGAAKAAEIHLGAYAKTNDFRVQELIRTIVATLQETCPLAAKNGYATLWVADALLDYPGMRNYISPELQNTIAKAQADVGAEGLPDNVRRNVDPILMRPHSDFPPWVRFGDDAALKAALADAAGLNEFRLISRGSYIAAECLRGADFAASVYPALCRLIPSAVRAGAVPNSGACHVTVIRPNVLPDVVSRYGREAVDAVLARHDAVFALDFLGAAMTYSLDWEKNRLCFVVTVSSPALRDFVEDFRREFADVFADSPAPTSTPHLTFAVTPRDILAA